MKCIFCRTKLDNYGSICDGCARAIRNALQEADDFLSNRRVAKPRATVRRIVRQALRMFTTE